MNKTTRPAPTASRRRQRSRGQALVEFALIFPIFLLVLSAIFDFGSMLYSRMTVINVAREGARAAVTAPDKTHLGSLASGAVLAASSGLLSGTPGVTTSCIHGVSGSAVTCSSAVAGDSVRVTVSYQYPTFFPLLFGATIDLDSTVQMVLE